jgi:hypothetical protein
MSYPEVAINEYVWEQFRLAKPAIHAQYGTTVPFFPVDDVQAGDSAWDGKTHIIYDSMVRPRSTRKSFYPVKNGQMIYSIKGSIKDIFEWREFIVDVLDREDAAAQDINRYSGLNIAGYNIFFHSVCAYQFNYVNMAYKSQPTQRKDQTAEIVIPYEFHKATVYNA